MKNKKYIIFFIVLWSVSIPLLHQLLVWQHNHLMTSFREEARILHDSIAEKFNLLMESHRALGILSSEYYSSGRINDKEYNHLASRVIHNFDEILGLKVINEKGIIIKVSPNTSNNRALGKKTQNFDELLESSHKLEQFWLSPPFKLYQGEEGFAFYMPIYKDNRLEGWIAPVISRHIFFNKFMKSEVLKKYHLNIIDEESGRPYFLTSPLPARPVAIVANEIEIWGRKIKFISWPIDQQMLGRNEFITSLVLSLFIALLGTSCLWLLDYRATIRKRLDALTLLLRVTIKDTRKSLVTINNQLNHMKLGTSQDQLGRLSKHIGYISTMIRQIEVLQDLSGKKTSEDFVKFPILPVILDLVELFHENLENKQLVVDYDPEEMARIEIKADKWLISHSVLGHFLKQAINLSPVEGDIFFKHYRENNFRCLTIEHTGKGFTDDLIEGRISDEANFVAEKVIHLHHGKIFFSNTSKGGKVTIKLPIPK